MDFGELILWGIPVIGLVGGIVAFIEYIAGGLGDKLKNIIGGALFAGGVFLVMSMDDVLVLWPWFGVWGQRVLWTITGLLFYTGHYPLVNRLSARGVGNVVKAAVHDRYMF